MKRDYSSTHVKFDSILSKIILDEAKNLIKSDDVYSLSQGYETNPHVTILYGIHDDRPSVELTEIIKSYPKFTISLGNISLFYGDETGSLFDVVKLGVNSTDLHILNNAFEECCEFTSKFPTYNPHVTLAYVKKGLYDHLDGLSTLKGISMVATHVAFSDPNGRETMIPLGVK